MLDAEKIWSIEIKLRAGTTSSEISDQELREQAEIAHRLEHAYWSIYMSYNYPLNDLSKITKPSPDADLFGLDPRGRLVEMAREYIDVVFLGPLEQAAKMLATDTCLLSSARTRLLFADEQPDWEMVLKNTLAATDALSAKMAMDGVSNAL